MIVQGKAPLSLTRSELLEYLESLESQVRKAAGLEWEMKIDIVTSEPYVNEAGYTCRDDTGQRELTFKVAFTVPKEKTDGDT